jgi:hypothetical protein
MNYAGISWASTFDWSAPAGCLLDELVEALPSGRPFVITVFGSAPLQLGIQRSFASADVDIMCDQDLNPYLEKAGLLESQRKFYIQACPPGTFRASSSWMTRAHTEKRGSITFYFPHPLDILVSKISRLEEKDLKAFHLVVGETGHPTEAELVSCLQESVDLYRPKFDEEAAGDPLTNTRRLWIELFGHDLDVRKEIITPALLARRKAYEQDVPSWKSGPMG